MLASNIAHGDSLKRLGIRLDNFSAATRMTVRPTVAAAVAIAVISITLALPEVSIQRVVLNFVYYIGWGFAQQYALQGFILVRLIDAGFDRRAPVCAAAVFALIHAPNPGLMVMVLLAAGSGPPCFGANPTLSYSR